MKTQSIKMSDRQQQKVHIDQALIKSSSSTLPDELKELGVCAYNENDFQKGVLYQVDMQLAEFELQEAEKKGKKKTRSDEDDNDDRYEQKRARLESTLENYSSYLTYNEDDEPPTTTTVSSDAAAASGSADAEPESERMIKMGEMTPFGGSILSHLLDITRFTHDIHYNIRNL